MKEKPRADFPLFFVAEGERTARMSVLPQKAEGLASRNKQVFVALQLS